MNKKSVFHLFSSLICFTLAVDGFALPKDPQIASGTAEFKQINDHVMEIHPSDQAIINYSKFDIGSQEKVRFVQRSSSSSVLNRVEGKDPSQILGSLESNGKVFLVNPNGIYFGASSTVNLGSLIASTLDIADEDFLKENYKFTLSNKLSEIRNEGSLLSAEGSIALIAPKIQNLGSIVAKAGTVLLASGEHVTLDFTGVGLIQFSVEGSLKESLIEHLGEIKASTVALKLPVAKKAIAEMLNLEGMEEADIFISEDGVIKFASAASNQASKVVLEAATLSIEGTIDATTSEKGGELHLLGKDIFLTGAKIDVSGTFGGGEVLIGGEYQGKGTTPWASKVIMDETSQILASAIESGDGGLVVLWSQDQTLFNGRIESKGGLLSGDGGLVETSSQGVLGVITGQVDTISPNGEIGRWLLDPYHIVVSNSTYTGTCIDGCSCTVNYCYVYNETINNSSSNITLTATYVDVDYAINIKTSGVSIDFQGCINCTTSNLCTLEADIKTNGGDITFKDFYISSFPCSMNTNGGNIDFKNSILTVYSAFETINTNGGDLSFDSTSEFILANNYTVSTAGGTASMPKVSRRDPSNVYEVYPSNLIVNAGTGTLTLNTLKALDSIAITAGAIYSSGMSTKGGSGISMSSGSVFVVEQSSVTLDTSEGNGPITLGSISASGKNVILNSGSGAIDVKGSITAASFSANGGSSLKIGSLNANSFSYGAATSLTIGSLYLNPNSITI